MSHLIFRNFRGPSFFLERYSLDAADVRRKSYNQFLRAAMGLNLIIKKSMRFLKLENLLIFAFVNDAWSQRKKNLRGKHKNWKIKNFDFLILLFQSTTQMQTSVWPRAQLRITLIMTLFLPSDGLVGKYVKPKI